MVKVHNTPKPNFLQHSMANEQNTIIESLKKDIEVLKRAYGFLLATYLVFSGLFFCIIAYLVIW